MPQRVLHKSWWDHNWYKVALVALFVWTTIGFVRTEQAANSAKDASAKIKNETVQNAANATALAEVVQRLDTEAHEREVQFCQLVLGNFEDRKRRLGRTKEFLHSRAGREPTALNIYIRKISLPQSKAEVRREREGIPTVCLKYKPKEGAQ
jgi:hypothetical protein